MGVKSVVAVACALLSSGAALAVETPIQFNLINVGGVTPGTSAYNGFRTAAYYWSSVLTAPQPVTINLQVGFQSLGPGILGSTGSTRTVQPAIFVVDRIAARQSTAFDSNLTLPTFHDGQFGPGTALNMYTPGYTGVDANGNNFGIDNSSKVYDTDGKYNATFIAVNTANARALGYNLGNTVDGTVKFSSDFRFDFNPRDGIAPGKTDFLAVAIHEIGHALGFVSGVDDYDFVGTGGPLANVPCFAGGITCANYPDVQNDWWGSTLDLFRYSAAGKLDWTTNTASYFSADGGVSAYQNGLFSTGSFNGDGWQASHWKAPQLPNGDFSCLRPKLGIMNPYICDGQLGRLTGRDLAAFDAIGYNTPIDLNNYSMTTGQISIASDITVPEPASWAMLVSGFGLVGGALRRRRQPQPA
ncbi:MAG: NF038122 family metalloprotease [Sphingomonadales bacterium]|jgi:hypothetical protein